MEGKGPKDWTVPLPTMPSYFPVPVMFFSSLLSIVSDRKNCQTFITVWIRGLAHGVGRGLPVQCGVHPYAAETILVEQAAGSSASARTRQFVTGRGVGLGKIDHETVGCSTLLERHANASADLRRCVHLQGHICRASDRLAENDIR
jgi:hypothetical protein